jgi:hypothetical protein
LDLIAVRDQRKHVGAPGQDGLHYRHWRTALLIDESPCEQDAGSTAEANDTLLHVPREYEQPHTTHRPHHSIVNHTRSHSTHHRPSQLTDLDSGRRQRLRGIFNEHCHAT